MYRITGFQIVSLLVGLVMIASYFGCAPVEPEPEPSLKIVPTEEVRIGTLFAYSGPLREFGPNLKNGCMLAAKQLKASGLNIKMFHEDSKTSAIPAVNAAKRLVEKREVIAIIGALSSGVTLSVAESVTCPSGVVHISPASSSPLITVLPADKGVDMLFRTCSSDALQGIVAAKLAVTFSKTASVLYVNNPYGQGLAEQFMSSYEKRGGKVLAMVPHDERAAQSYRAELKKALEGNPDIVCAYSYKEHAKVYIKEAIKLHGFKNFLYCDGTKSIDIVRAVGAANVEGKMGTAPAPAIMKGESYNIFVSDYKAKYKVPPQLPFISNAYDATAVLGLAAYAATVKGKPITAANVRDQLHYVSNPPGEVIRAGEFKKAFDLLKAGKNVNYEGASGWVDFNEDGDVRTPVEIWKYIDGKMVTVKEVSNIPKEGPYAK